MRKAFVIVGAVVVGVMPWALVSPAGATGTADLSASISATANADGTVSVTAGVHNDGTGDAGDVTLTVPLPAGLAMSGTPSGPCVFDQGADAVVCSSVINGVDNPIGANQGVATNFTMVACAPVSNVTISDTVTSPDDSNPGNNAAQSTPFTPTTDAACADVGIQMSGPTSDIVAGVPFTYTINVGNAGPSSAGPSSLTDVLPPGLTVTSVSPPLSNNSGCSVNGQKVSCAGPGLAPGPGPTITINAVASSTSTTETLTNTAVLTSSTPDAATTNNVASVPTIIDPSIGAGGTVGDSGGTVSTGNDATSSVPVQTAVTLPAGGTVTITETSTPTAVPSSYTLLGGEVVVSSTYSSTTSPLTITFRIDGATLAGAGLTEQTVAISRDGIVLGDCSVSPIPCVLSRSFDSSTGDAVISVSTDHASHWDALKPPFIYPFQGFFSPVRNAPTVTTASAGTIIPVKFSVGGQISGPFADESYGVTDCATFAPPSTFSAAPGSLAFNATTGRYTFSWQTAKLMAGKCVEFVLKLNGTWHTANVRLTK